MPVRARAPLRAMDVIRSRFGKRERPALVDAARSRRGQPALWGWLERVPAVGPRGRGGEARGSLEGQGWPIEAGVVRSTKSGRRSPGSVCGRRRARDRRAALSTKSGRRSPASSAMDHWVRHSHALSMKSGRRSPGKGRSLRVPSTGRRQFNEGGAVKPRTPSPACPPSSSRRRFNEVPALSRGKDAQCPRIRPGAGGRFNEAGGSAGECSIGQVCRACGCSVQ